MGEAPEAALIEPVTYARRESASGTSAEYDGELVDFKRMIENARKNRERGSE
jgi:hypothetical protein